MINWKRHQQSGFYKGLLHWSYTITDFPKWNPKIFNLKESSFRCLKDSLLSQPCKTSSGRQMKISTPHRKADCTVNANVLVSTRELTRGRRELQEMFQSLPAPYYTHNNPVKNTKPSEINLHIICHLKTLHLSDIPQSLLTGQGSWSILWSTDVFLCGILQHTWSTCSVNSREWWQAAQGPAACCANTAGLLHFQPCVPLPHHVFPCGFSTTTVSYVQIFSSYLRIILDLQVTLEAIWLISFPSGWPAVCCWERKCQAMTPVSNLLCSFENWSFLSSMEDVPQVPVSLFPPAAGPITVITGSFAPSPLPSAPWGFVSGPKNGHAEDMHLSNSSLTILNNDWDHCEWTSTCEQSIIWVELSGQGPQAPWVADHNIVQVHLFTSTPLFLCVFVCVCLYFRVEAYQCEKPTTCRREKGWSNASLGWRGKPKEH